MIETIQSLEDEKFQRAVLSGVFRNPAVVDGLVTKRRTLPEALKLETNIALLRLLGLYPYRPTSAVTEAFMRMISNPAEYRNEICAAAEMFWESSFATTWSKVESLMHHRVRTMRESLARSSLSAFAREINLPVLFDDRTSTVTTLRGSRLFSYREIREIHVMPSAFNDAHFWGAYRDSPKAVRLYFPVFDSSLIRGAVPQHRARSATYAGATSIDPSLVFRALGDTTRFAMACIIARSPRTSMELAKDFGVSKATISHHVSVLRRAGLLRETPTDKGVALTLDRQALEDLSSRSARAMFSSASAPVVRRSRRDTQKRNRHTGKNQ
jgi:DNA-binding transcriptional ArsR family regulator